MSQYILAVDDDPAILEFYTKIFQTGGGGFDVLPNVQSDSADGIKCLGFCDATVMLARYETMLKNGDSLPLCVLDMRMPQKNGFETALLLRKLDPEIEIVFCTAYSDVSPQEIRTAMGERFCLLHKPFHTEEFVLLVRSLVEQWNTRRRLIESRTALTRSRANFDGLFNAIDILLFVLGMNGKVLHANTAVCQRLGYELDDVIGRDVIDFHPESLRPRAAEIVRDMLAGKTDQCPLPLVARNGEWVHAETRIVTGTWNDAPAIFAACKDITDLKNSEQKFSRAFQYSPVIMAISRADDGVYLEVNDSFVENLGYSREEAIGQHYQALRLYQNPEERETLIRDARQHGVVKERLTHFRHRNGGLRVGLMCATLIQVESVECLLTATLDITGRDEADRKLAAEMKTRFLAMASHELRTPLANLSLGVNLLHESFGTLPAARRESLLATISQEAVKMSEMLDNLLVSSRLDQERLECFHAWSHLPDLLDEELRNLPADCARRVVRSLDLPEPRLVLDQVLLRHILRNLLGNACKYSPPTEPVELEIRHDHGILHLAVKDRGIGVPSDHEPRLFDGFFRAGNVGTTPGTGLGLFIVKRCAELHGGSVCYAPRPGGGSEFHVRIRTMEPC